MLSLLAAKLSTRGTNVYATLHWAYFLSPFQHGQLGRLKGRLQLLNLRWLLGRGVRLMVHSAELAQTLRRLTGSQHVDYVPYPVEVPPLGDVRLPGLQLRERLGLAPSDKLLLAFGTVRHDKGVDLAIEALGALPGQYHLLVAGPPATFGAEDIARFAAQHAVGARVHTELGFIPDAEVGAYFAASDVVLIPYRKSFAGQSGPLTIARRAGAAPRGGGRGHSARNGRGIPTGRAVRGRGRAEHGAGHRNRRQQRRRSTQSALFARPCPRSASPRPCSPATRARLSRLKASGAKPPSFTHPTVPPRTKPCKEPSRFTARTC